MVGVFWSAPTTTVPDTLSHYRERLQTGDKTYVIVATFIPMGKVFNAFAKLKRVEAHRIRFLWCGENISHLQTLGELQLDDAGCIDCMLEQVRLFLRLCRMKVFALSRVRLPFGSVDFVRRILSISF
jgi:hypothetical protein